MPNFIYYSINHSKNSSKGDVVKLNFTTSPFEEFSALFHFLYILLCYDAIYIKEEIAHENINYRR